MYTAWNLVDTFPFHGLDARLSYTYEDIAIRDCFDDTVYDIPEMERKVNDWEAYWIMGRVQLFLDGVEIGDSIVGGIYVESLDELKEYYLDDLCYEAYEEAKDWYNKNKGFLESYEFNVKD